MKLILSGLKKGHAVVVRGIEDGVEVDLADVPPNYVIELKFGKDVQGLVEAVERLERAQRASKETIAKVLEDAARAASAPRVVVGSAEPPA